MLFLNIIKASEIENDSTSNIVSGILNRELYLLLVYLYIMCLLSGMMFAFILKILDILNKNILMWIPTEDYLIP